MMKYLKIARLALGGAILGYAAAGAFISMTNAPEAFGVVGWLAGFSAAALAAAKAAAVV